MARKTRDVRLESRSARDKLQAGQYHWRGIRKGLAIGYRKAAGKGRVGGSWTVRLLGDDGKYVTDAIGIADDHQDPNGDTVLSYDEAQEKARMWADEYAKRQAGVSNGPFFVADAVRDYLDWYASHRKALARTRQVAEAHILPALGDRLVSELTTRDIRQWLEALAKAPARLRTGKAKPQNIRETTDRRPRQATANRILTVLKAALNHAWREGKVPSDEAWRRVKPFRAVDAPKIRFLNEAEATRLINACPEDFRLLVTAALLTGCRYGELATMRVNDFHPDAGTVLVRESKSGRPRHVPLTEEGRRFFERAAIGKRGDDRLFVRGDGESWGESHQKRPLRRACEAAGIDPPISFHALRHTYGSMLALRGVSLQVIAEALGHADTRITSRHYGHLLPSYVADTIRAHLPSFGVEQDNVVSLRR